MANRYNKLPPKLGKDNKSLFQTIRYIDIPNTFEDTYIFTTIGDRYDTLALQYYKDPSMWWVISIANPSQRFDSLTPKIGSQIRIPNIQTANNIKNQYT